MRKLNNDLIGRRFHKLVIVEFAERDKNGFIKWRCKCDCGNEKIVYEQSLCRGATKSCGCYNREASKARMSKGWAKIFTEEYLVQKHKVEQKSLRQIAAEAGCTLGCVMRYIRKYKIQANDLFYDIVGKKFGKLKVISLSHFHGGSSYWNVECDCGNKKVVVGRSLVRHSIVSCGCWNREKCWKGCGDLSKSYWTKVVKGAVKRNIPLDVTMQEAWDLFLKQDKKCALSGVDIFLDRQPSQNYDKHTWKQTASFDRIDSAKGYTIDNVQWIHKDLNLMKMDLSQEKFIDWCKKVAEIWTLS